MRRVKSLVLSMAALLALSSLFAASAFATSPPVNTTKPIILGTPEVGKRQTASHGSWTESPTSYAYQWERCNSAGAECANIAGATEQYYTTTKSDAYHKLVIKVTAYNSAGEGVATSNPTMEILPVAPELSPAPSEKEPLSFTGSGSNVRFEWTSGDFIVCDTANLSGRFVNASEAQGVKVAFSGCSGNPGHEAFSTAALRGTLGWVNRSTHAIGMRLAPESGSTWATGFLYATESLNGSVVGTIGPVNTRTTGFTLTYHESHGTQELLGFENGLSQQLSLASTGYSVGEEGTMSLNTATSVEIKG